MSRAAGVTAVVVATRGGAGLARALASVAWADERVVLDPTDRLAPAALAAGTRRIVGTDLAAAVSSGWLVLLREDESAGSALAVAVAAATRASAARGGYRVRQEVEGFGARFRPPGAPVRLARRGGARLRVAVHGEIAIAAPEPRPGRLDACVTVHAARSVSDAVDEIEADGSVLAALLARDGVRAGVGRSVLAAFAAGVRMMCARRVRPDPGPACWPHARWYLTMLAGYRALLAYAKLWERAEREGSPPT